MPQNKLKEKTDKFLEIRNPEKAVGLWSCHADFSTTLRPVEPTRATIGKFFNYDLERFETHAEALKMMRAKGWKIEMRFAAVMMLCHFISEEYIDGVISELDSAKNDAYYYMMAKAWTLSVCFVKFPEKTMDYLQKGTLDDITLRMTVRKIRESYRVSDDLKRRVRELV